MIAAPAVPQPSSARVVEASLKSTAVGADLPYVVYLPPGYDSSQEQRYPVLYMLHGLGGDRNQWRQEGMFAVADSLMRSDAIQPMIIVTPEGSNSYWVNHANGGPGWGTYVSRDLVQEIDKTYRTAAGREYRAIGGSSMGGHGALQLAMNSNVFGVVGAHSVALRRYEETFPFFGDRAYFEAHDPVTLCKRQPTKAQDLVIWLDIGQDDRWLPAARAFHEQLASAGVLHTWHVSPGGHDADYWGAHLQEYLEFYSRALATPVSSNSSAARARK
ncbi:MAG TPA: alpha/beta hydrolase-fold protein [Dehalococcoidia bacterium]|nr:alpha/beta hydrolase-fold protein [Dehalococcoidia bacterium]